MKAHALAELFPMMEGEALDALADDIGKHGQREDIVLLDGAILDGRDRYRACAMAGVAPRFRDFAGDDALAFVLSLNLTRRHLNESQRAMVAARLETMKQGRPAKDANLHLSRGEAAERLHVAPRTVAHAAVVRDQASPEIRRAVDDGKMAVSAAAQAAKLPVAQQRRIAERAEAGDDNAARTILKQESRAAREIELAAQQKALPDQTFGVIYADPEWRFDPRSRETGLDRAADNHYPTSDLATIKARDVGSIAAADAVLFLWSPANRVADAIDVMKAWGFAYVTQIIWAKTKIALGYWVRDKHEVLLIGRRGKIMAPAPGKQCDSLIAAPVGEHSAKPDVFAEIIERYFPHLPKIELNRRGPPRRGWDAWGCEAQAASGADPHAGPLPTANAQRSAAEAREEEGGEPAWWAPARRMRGDGARIFDIAARFEKSPSTVHHALEKMRAAGPSPQFITGEEAR